MPSGGLRAGAAGVIAGHNPLAAMPSIRMAYAEITSTGIARPRARRSCATYRRHIRLRVALIVLATANHYLLDVLAGSLLRRASLSLARCPRPRDRPRA
jgi:hypothetical protein